MGGFTPEYIAIPVEKISKVTDIQKKRLSNAE